RPLAVTGGGVDEDPRHGAVFSLPAVDPLPERRAPVAALETEPPDEEVRKRVEQKECRGESPCVSTHLRGNVRLVSAKFGRPIPCFLCPASEGVVPEGQEDSLAVDTYCGKPPEAVSGEAELLPVLRVVLPVVGRVDPGEAREGPRLRELLHEHDVL